MDQASQPSETRQWLQGLLLPESLVAAIVVPAVYAIIYGVCGWITAGRGSLPAVYWWWEETIPFVPVMIVPYLSWDLLLVGSIFLCGNRPELKSHIERLMLVLGVAAAGFLVWPLQFGMARPAVHGVWQSVFTALWKIDSNHNMFPSLHVATSIIVWTIFGRHLKGTLRWAMHAWFGLVVLSTLLTRQHHLDDVLGGAALGAISCLVFRPR